MTRKALNSSAAHDQAATALPGSGAPPPLRPWLPEEHLAPAYPVPYGPTSLGAIKGALDRIRNFVHANTPTRVLQRSTGTEITDFSEAHADAEVQPGAFRLICYEWGVTYAGMLYAAEVTGDVAFARYAVERLSFIAERLPYFRRVADLLGPEESKRMAFRGLISPRNLDDAGSLCAAMIKARRSNLVHGLDPIIDGLIGYITHGQFRLEDGTLARNRPLPRSLWLDDLYMSVPALAQMGAATGRSEYIDDALRQVTQFSARMFSPGKGLYMHGWIEGMEVHPEFHWARSNGWALLATTELLDVLPESHPGRAGVLELLRRHIRGLAICQSGQGRWHQLLDRSDSYLETSASAIFTYCIARAINRGWVDALAYGPMVQLAWNAVAAQVDVEGQVHGTCVGSGMAMDPMFYYYRPTSPLAAHGYGPMLLAGAEMIRLIESDRATMHDSAMHFGETEEEA